MTILWLASHPTDTTLMLQEKKEEIVGGREEMMDEKRGKVNAKKRKSKQNLMEKGH